MDIFSEIEGLTEAIAMVSAIVLSGFVTFIIVPHIMNKMETRGIVGRDWNKPDRPEIPELGGIALLFGFPVGLSIATGLLKLLGSFDATPILAAIGVLFIAGMIGIIDDISDVPQRYKAIVVSFAALPLLLARFGHEIIALPFNTFVDLSSVPLLYWLVIVPIAITGAANATNMSAGYNGLESGQITIISLSLLAVVFLSNGRFEAVLIFSALLGSSLALNHYNGYPAVTFVGDVGTLSMGAVIGAGVIIGGIEFAGFIAIFPAFYEAFATGYYSFVKKASRKDACKAPTIDAKGRLHPPKGAEKYTLAYLILSRRPMTEQGIVRTILSLYLLCGIAAIILTIL